MIVYIAGPISGLTSVPMDEKLMRFMRAEEWLLAQNHDVKNPLRSGNDQCFIGDNGPICNPEGHIGQDGKASHSWACYMKHDIRDLMLCDSIALLPGWDESRGATMEYKLAHDLEMTVMYLNDQGVVV